MHRLFVIALSMLALLSPAVAEPVRDAERAGIGG
jgi:hypothetical protein